MWGPEKGSIPLGSSLWGMAGPIPQIGKSSSHLGGPLGPELGSLFHCLPALPIPRTILDLDSSCPEGCPGGQRAEAWQGHSRPPASTTVPRSLEIWERA